LDFGGEQCISRKKRGKSDGSQKSSGARKEGAKGFYPGTVALSGAPRGEKKRVNQRKSNSIEDTPQESVLLSWWGGRSKFWSYPGG